MTVFAKPCLGDEIKSACHIIEIRRQCCILSHPLSFVPKSRNRIFKAPGLPLSTHHTQSYLTHRSKAIQASLRSYKSRFLDSHAKPYHNQFLTHHHFPSHNFPSTYPLAHPANQKRWIQPLPQSTSLNNVCYPSTNPIAQTPTSRKNQQCSDAAP